MVIGNGRQTGDPIAWWTSAVCSWNITINCESDSIVGQMNRQSSNNSPILMSLGGGSHRLILSFLLDKFNFRNWCIYGQRYNRPRKSWGKGQCPLSAILNELSWFTLVREAGTHTSSTTNPKMFTVTTYVRTVTIKQLLDEVEHDIMRKPNSIIVLLYICHIIHPQKQKRSVQPFCFWGEHPKGLSNQADVELDMINAISAADTPNWNKVVIEKGKKQKAKWGIISV